jgi:hypothetical protein
MWNSAKWTLLLVFHHSSPATSIEETVYEMRVGISLFVNVLGILTMTALQHNTAILDHTVYNQELRQVTAVPAPSTRD